MLNEHVEPERRHLRRAFARVECGSQPARAEEQRDESAKELGVEVEKTLQRLEKRVPERTVDVEVVLAATVAKRTAQRRAAILAMAVARAVMMCALGGMRRCGVGGDGLGDQIGRIRQIGWAGHAPSRSEESGKSDGLDTRRAEQAPDQAAILRRRIIADRPAESRRNRASVVARAFASPTVGRGCDRFPQARVWECA